MSNIYGIDVSAWQGTIDWAKVKKAGCGHAVLKINMKNLAADKQFATNIKGCKAQGIPYGVYRYVYESTENYPDGQHPCRSAGNRVFRVRVWRLLRQILV